MLLPKRVKHRKTHKGRIHGNAKGGTEVSFGAFALKAQQAGWISNRQIESCRVAINRHCKRQAKLWIRIFPDKPLTKKPAETRMGKGKGNPESWVAVIKPGRVLFEIDGVSEELARGAMRKAMHKLPLKCVFIKRDYKSIVATAQTGPDDTTATEDAQ